MVLSLQRLNKMLREKGLLPKRYFTIDNYCVYVELLVVSTADMILLYVPSKYNIEALPDGNTFKISSIDVAEDGTIAGDYASAMGANEIEEYYEGVDIDIRTGKGEDVEKYLQGDYNRPLHLKNITKRDMQQLKEIFRQLKRLKLCVQNVKYKLCISYKNYLCCVRRDETLEGFAIKSLTGKATQRLLVTIDLETLYSRSESVVLEIKTVRKGIYRVLDKNHSKHTVDLQKIIDHKIVFVNSSKFLSSKKQKYISYLHDLEVILEQLNNTERDVSEKISNINKRYSDKVGVGIHKDIEKSHLISKEEKRLGNLNILKQDTTRAILTVKTELEDLSLKIDKVCFDNIVMLDAILKNFVDMTEF